VEAVTNVRAQEPVGPGNSDDGDDVADETWAVPGEGNLLDDTNRAIIESLQRDGESSSSGRAESSRSWP